MLRAEDIVMGFGPPQGDPQVEAALAMAHTRGAMTLALPGVRGSYALQTPVSNPFLHQELIEILYHTLWETVHVFFEHREMGGGIGAAGFLYPFLGNEKLETGDIVDDVAESIQAKAREDKFLRLQVAQAEAGQIVNVALAIHERLAQGGKLIVFGNGGSATDANDFVIDCVAPPAGYRPVPAISLSMEPSNLTAIANDFGIDLIFLRQIVTHAQTVDVAIAISTRGGSRNLILALEEARKRGLLTVALLGYDGGEILRRELADFPLIVRADYIPRSQEVQASTYHLIRETLEVIARAPI
jgi:D-sedoheptulose 7-phosphate isomerase